MDTDDLEYSEIAKLIKPTKKGPARPDVLIQVNATKPQAQFLATCDEPPGDELKEILFSGGVGAGKSYSLVLALLKYCSYPNTTVILGHLHLSVLRRTTLPLLIQGTISASGELRAPMVGPECIAGFNKTNGEILLHNGSRIILVGIKDCEKIRSINACAAFLDEATLLDKSSYLAVLQRCRVYHPLGNGVYSATNPSDVNHWAYKYFEGQASPYRRMIVVDSRSNAANLPKAYVKSLENLPEEDRQKMLEGRWISSGSRVFYTFKPTHVQDLNGWVSDNYDDYMLCNDLGGGAKYSGSLLIGRRDGVHYVLDEYSSLESTHRQILGWLEQYRHLTELVSYDPANACLKNDLENAGWIPLKPVKDIELGVSKLNSLFQEGRIVVSSRCQKTIKQLNEAHRNPDTNKWDKDKAEIDLLDALRYGLLVMEDGGTMAKHKPQDVFCFRL